MTEPTLKRTPLYERHVALGARMVEFGGWEMPVQYSGIVPEHQAIRTAAGVFDISHMGEVDVRGPDALAYLQHLTTQDVSTIAVGQSAYALLCQKAGGIVDDIFIYHLPERYLVVINASNIEKDVAWMRKHTGGFDVELDDVSDATALVALQGPGAEALLAGIAGSVATDLPYHGVAAASVGALPVIAARTGYTGEDGFELFTSAAHAPELWDALVAAGATPCGLGARDSLRFEACLALYGHEIDDSTNPYEAKLGWVVKPAKGPFIGDAALAEVKANGPARRLVGFEVTGRGIARGGYTIRSTDGTELGLVTTGMPAPSLGKNLGLGYVPPEYAAEGTEIEIIVRDRPVRAVVVKTPFYKPRYKK